MNSGDVLTTYFSEVPGDWTGPVDQPGARRQIQKMGLHPDRQKGIVGNIFALENIRPAAWCEQLLVHDGNVVAVAAGNREEPTIAYGVHFTVAAVRGRTDGTNQVVAVELGDSRDRVALSAKTVVERVFSSTNLALYAPEATTQGKSVIISAPYNGIPHVVVYAGREARQHEQLLKGTTVKIGTTTDSATARCTITEVGLRREDATPVVDVTVYDRKLNKSSMIVFPLAFAPKK